MTTGRTPQQTLAAVYDEGAAAYEKYWAPVLHRHALDLVNTVTSAAAPAPRIWRTWSPVPAPWCRHCEPCRQRWTSHRS